MITHEKKVISQSDIQRQMPFAYWLATRRGVGSKTIALLTEHFGTPEAIYYATQEQLESVLKEGKKVQILCQKKNWNLYTEYEALQKQKIAFIPQFHSNYPEKLLQIPDAPYGIYVKGSLPADEIPSVAMIGARICSEYGRHMAKEFGAALAGAGIQVISGMARGIDGIGQKAAIQAGGASYGVLGCGVDICYPLENKDLYDRITEKGGILSEYVPKTMPKSELFPPRNRIISGLADIVLVIEAREKSGTFITVDMALEQGKEVYVLPGRVGDMLSVGCNRLLQEGAGIALSPQHFVEEIANKYCNKMQLLPNHQRKEARNKPQSKLMDCIDYYPRTWEMIWEQYTKESATESSPKQIMQELLELELEGSIIQKGGSFYKR